MLHSLATRDGRRWGETSQTARVLVEELVEVRADIDGEADTKSDRGSGLSHIIISQRLPIGLWLTRLPWE